MAILPFLMSLACSVLARNLSPMEYGLQNAKTGIDRYYVLLRTHEAADSLCCGVSYEGINTIEIEIPKSAKSISLSEFTDFAGVELIVHNMEKTMPLFIIDKELREVDVLKEEISSGNFKKHVQLCQGKKLLVIEDLTPWVKNRRGYNYGTNRSDLLLIEDGIAVNRPIASYDNESSDPKVFFCDVNKNPIMIKNLIFTRSKDSKCVTRLLSINGQNNVKLINIIVNTPEHPTLYGDLCLAITNSSNVVFKDVTINGTYSQTNKYGYGIYMNNVWNSMFERLKAYGKWGIFGTNNMNNVIIVNSDINRFDIHCYGRDVFCENVLFRDQYNQFSSIFGTVEFTQCVFYSFTPFLYESSYNAYTPFDLVFNKCTFKLNAANNCIITLYGVPEAYNDRSELRRKCLPNITIKNSNVELADDVSKWYLIQTGGLHYKDSFDYISNIILKKVCVYNGKGKKMFLSSEPLRMTNEVKKVFNIISK